MLILVLDQLIHKIPSLVDLNYFKTLRSHLVLDFVKFRFCVCV